MAAAQLAGEDFLVGLDRLRADKAGQQVTLVAGLAASSAGQVARRFTPEHWRGAERGLATATARMLGLLPAERAAELAGGGPVTIDIDATDVEVYGSKKQGVAYNYQGQRAGRPHVAAWAETEIPLAADLLAGDSDPRSHVVTLLGRALAALPQQVRDGAKAAGRKIALRADAGYFAGDLARAAIKHEMEFAIGAKRISSMWRALAGIDEDAWRDAIDMPGAQVAVSPYKPAGWPSDTVLLIRRVRLDPDRVSADPRSRRRRTLDPRQRALPIPELEQEPEIYAYSFICTNMDVSTPARAAAAEHWYRHRTVIENIFRDSKHGAALRHLPSGSNDRTHHPASRKAQLDTTILAGLRATRPSSPMRSAPSWRLPRRSPGSATVRTNQIIWIAEPKLSMGGRYGTVRTGDRTSAAGTAGRRHARRRLDPRRSQVHDRAAEQDHLGTDPGQGRVRPGHRARHRLASGRGERHNHGDCRIHRHEERQARQTPAFRRLLRDRHLPTHHLSALTGSSRPARASP